MFRRFRSHRRLLEASDVRIALYQDRCRSPVRDEETQAQQECRRCRKEIGNPQKATKPASPKAAADTSGHQSRTRSKTKRM